MSRRKTYTPVDPDVMRLVRPANASQAFIIGRLLSPPQRMAREDGWVEVSNPQMAELTGYSARAISRARKDLVAAGLVEVDAQPGFRSRWRVVVEELDRRLDLLDASTPDAASTPDEPSSPDAASRVGGRRGVRGTHDAASGVTHDAASPLTPRHGSGITQAETLSPATPDAASPLTPRLPIGDKGDIEETGGIPRALAPAPTREAEASPPPSPLDDLEPHLRSAAETWCSLPDRWPPPRGHFVPAVLSPRALRARYAEDLAFMAGRQPAEFVSAVEAVEAKGVEWRGWYQPSGHPVKNPLQVLGWELERLRERSARPGRLGAEGTSVGVCAPGAAPPEDWEPEVIDLTEAYAARGSGRRWTAEGGSR